MEQEIIFEAKKMRKEFGPTIALNDVDFVLRRGHFISGIYKSKGDFMYDTKNYDLFGIFLNAYRIRHIQLSAAADSLSAIDFKFRGQIYQDGWMLFFSRKETRSSSLSRKDGL